MLSSMTAATLEDAIARLDRREKFALLEKLWAMIETDELPVPPEVAAELDRRWADYQKNPNSALTYDELMARVQAKRR
jgi:putative addiction module component (TIGR02574 family)